MSLTSQTISFLTLVCILVVSLLVTASAFSRDGNCPRQCSCQGRTVDCKSRGLTSVPTGFPSNVERINLIGNKISSIRRSDFKGLRNLNFLQLLNNEIESIEPGSFDDLINLKRLRLNKNNLKLLPDNLFIHTPKLQRLDIKENQLKCIGKQTFAGLRSVRSLQLDQNQIVWLSNEALSGMADLSVLRLSQNPLACNCHLRWFNIYLSHRPSTGLKCATPPHLAGMEIGKLRSNDFQCPISDEGKLPGDCGNQFCSKSCICTADNTAKCNGRSLKQIPDDLPNTITEIDLQKNDIEIIPSRAFARYPLLKKIILNDNKITHLAPDAFDGVPSVTIIHFEKNRIKTIPRELFHGLKNLNVLYMYNNNISCIPLGTFKSSTNLIMVHLSQNNIQSLPEGLFQNATRLLYLYLARNPLICDCNLAWLRDTLQTREGEHSNAKCQAPPRMSHKLVRRTDASLFQCLGSEGAVTKEAGNCHLYQRCPKECKCSETRVDCRNAGFTKVPDNIPLYAEEIILKGNQITQIPSDSIFTKLKHLRILDLSDNKINRIVGSAFASLGELQELDLTNNELTQVDENTFRGLRKLNVLLLRMNKITCVNNDTFKETSSLKVLQINDNQIKCIMRGSFDGLNYLTNLNLENNPLRCNCHLDWLTDWARSHISLMNRFLLPRCSEPALLASTPITALDSRHFTCVKDKNLACNNGIPPCCSKDIISCDPRAYCPPNCQCEGTTVKCVNIKLTEIPHDIPIDTTKLHLERNSIQSINSTSLSRLTKLEDLILSNNAINELEANTFVGLSNLRSITLSFNKLQCIDQKAFTGLIKLQVLLLNSNDISTIPFGTFDDLKSLNNIALSQNPLHCDCNIKWLNGLFRDNFLDNGVALCASPKHMDHTSVYHANPSDFICSESRSNPSIAAKCDPCLSQPCLHNGKCTPMGQRKFACQCRQPYHGPFCQYEINACFGQPCKNGGTCKFVDRFGNYKCLCPPGFDGPKCNLNVNECEDHQCLNGALCIDRVNNYTCQCNPGFRGEFCEEQFTYCKDVNPCQNGASCQSIHNGYQCICPKGWRGKDCEINVDDCKYNACLNGATCVDDVDGYSCQCRPGYQGQFCQKFKWMPPPPEPSSDSVCSYHTCQHGGRCVNGVTPSEYYCVCQPGYGGKYCEQLHSVRFAEVDSFAALSPPSRAFLKPRGNITLEMATEHSEGLVLFHGNANQFIALDLFNGHLRTSYSLLKGRDSVGYSTYKVNDRKFHRIEVDIRGENVTVYIDGTVHTYLKAIVDSNNPFLAADSTILIGGGPNITLIPVVNSYRLKSNRGFGGCIGSAYLNGNQIDFLLVTSQSANMTPGCQAFKKPTNPCSKESACLNGGMCSLLPTKAERPRKRKGRSSGRDRRNRRQGGKVRRRRDEVPQAKLDYKCTCPTGFTGDRCQKESGGCQRKVQKTQVLDPQTRCISTRKVKMRVCVGQCEATGQPSMYNNPLLGHGTSVAQMCCRPVRYKERRLRFRCQDTGQIYEKYVKLIKKCQCQAC